MRCSHSILSFLKEYIYLTQVHYTFWYCVAFALFGEKEKFTKQMMFVWRTRVSFSILLIFATNKKCSYRWIGCLILVYVIFRFYLSVLRYIGGKFVHKSLTLWFMHFSCFDVIDICFGCLFFFFSFLSKKMHVKLTKCVVEGKCTVIFLIFLICFCRGFCLFMKLIFYINALMIHVKKVKLSTIFDNRFA